MFRKMVYLMAVLSMVLSIAPANAASTLFQGQAPQPVPIIPTVNPPQQGSTREDGSLPIGSANPNKPSHRTTQQDQGTAPESHAPAAEPPMLVTLKPGSDMHEFAGFLAWLRFGGQLTDFQPVENAAAFLVTGREGLGLIAAQPPVANLAPATAEKIAAVQADSRRPAQSALRLPARPSGIQAYPPTTPTVDIQIYNNWVFIGNAVTGTVYVTVTKGVGGAQYFTSYPFSSPGSVYLYPSVPYPYIEPGDTVEINEAGGSGLITIVIPDLRPTIDRHADTVSGQAPVPITSTDENTPPAIRVNSWAVVNRNTGAWESTGYKHPTTDASGNWSTVFTYTNPTTGTYDIRPFNTDIWVLYYDANHNVVWSLQYAPGLRVQLNTDYVSGYTKPRTSYTVTLKTSAGVVKGSFIGTASTDGSFSGYLRDVYGNSVKNAPGDTVYLEGAYSLSVDVVALTAMADPLADTVTGATPVVNSTSPITLPNLSIQVASGGYITNPTGTYLVYSNTVGSFNPGDSGSLRYYTANADQVYMNFVAPVLAARGYYNDSYQADNYASGYAPLPNAAVSLALKRAGATVGTAAALSNSNGWFTAYIKDIYGNAVNIQANDMLEASLGGSVFASLAVPAFDITSNPDPVNTVTGTTSATVITTTSGLAHTLAVWPITLYDYSYGKPVTPAIYAENPFYYNLYPSSPNTITWSGGTEGHYRYINGAGYQVYGKFTAYNLTPTLSLRWDRNYGSYGGYSDRLYALKDSVVSGKTKEPYAFVSIVLKRGGTPVGWAATTSDSSGNYVAQLRDALNAPAPILDGDTVEAAANGVTTSVAAPAMTANANYDTDIFIGTVNPIGSLQANYYYSYWRTVNVTPTADGAYSVTLPSLSSSYPQGYLNYADANGNHIYKAWTAASAPPPPGVAPQVVLRGNSSGWYADNYVYVYASASGWLTVTRGTAQLKTWNFGSYGYGTYLTDLDGNPIYLQAGDVVQATAGGATTVITVPTVSVTSDPALDRLTGTTNADVITTTYGATRTLALWPTYTSDYYYGKYVLPSSGTFMAANPFYYYADPANSSATLNWNAGTQGHYRYVDAAGNQVYGVFIAPYTPKLWIEENSNYLDGYVATPGVPVTVTLKDSTGAVKATRYTTSGKFDAYFEANLYDAVGNPVYILANDVVEVSASPTITVPVVPLSASVNANTNIVSGSGPANASLSVEVNGSCGASRPAITDGSSAFSVDFTGVCNILPGDYARIRYINANGHEIYLNRAPAPQLRVNKGNNYIEGYVAGPNTPAAGTLKDSSGAIRATAAMTSSWYGFYSFDFVTSTGVPAVIATGDIVEVVSGGAAMSLTVPTLTASVNPAADTVAGQAPTNATLNVALYNAGGSSLAQKTVTADGSGNYAAGNPWGTSSYDVLAGWRALVTYTNADGNQAYLNATAPVVYVRGDANGYTNQNRVTGYVTPFAVANVALKRGGSTVASALYSTDSSGWFNVDLYDVTGASASILDGDQVIVKGSVMTVTVPTINAAAYAVTNTLQGTISPAGSRLKAVDGNTGCAKPVTSDGTTGAFSATNPFYNSSGNSCSVTFYSGNAVDTHYMDASGNWVYQRFTVAGTAATGAAMIYARWDDNTGQVKPNYVSGYAAISNATVNLTLKRGGTTIGAATTTSGSNRGFSAALLDAGWRAVSILTGDVIEMISSGVTTTFTAPELTTAYNNASSVLYGKGPANSPLYCSDCGSSITTGPDGTYAVSAGDSGCVRYTDTTGNQVYTSWARPYVWVRENNNSVYGRVSTLNSPVTVTLKSGSNVKAVKATASDSDAYFSVNLTDMAGNPIVIAAGDTIEVSASPTVVVPVVPLSLNANLVTDVITGTGPVSATLDVYAGSVWRNPTSDASGAYTADYAGYYDLKPGDWVETSYWNNAGRYGIYLGYYAPLVRVNATANIVDGYTTPNKTVSLALKRGGSTLAAASATSNVDGFFSAFFTAAGSVVDILAGDIVDVTASPTNSITVPTLTASLNAAVNVVAGTAPASSTVRVWAFHWTGSGFTSYNKPVNTDGSGSYSADFTTDVNLLDYDYAYVRYTDANGNQSAVNTIPATSFWKTQAEQSVTDNGAALKTSTFGAGNYGDLSTPLLYTHSGGKIVFASRGGSLYLTAPDGAVYDTGATFFSANSAPSGVWKVQVRIQSGEGSQYAMAAGSAAYTLYLPLIWR